MKQALLAQLDNANEYFTPSTGTLTENDSAFAPADGVFTAANQVAHAAQTIDWFIDGAFNPNGFGMDFEGHERQVRAVTSLTEARTAMKRAIEHAKAVVESRSDEEWAQPLPPGPIMGGLPRSAIFGAITDHTAHHRGALTVYARLLGKTPAMPYMDDA